MGNYVEALRRLRQAADLFEWKLPAVRHNLGLAIVALLAGRDRETVERLWEAYDDWRDSLQRQRRDVAPKVSVVIPSFNHAAYIESTLESVLRQTYPSIEIVVIDDGSSDDSADRIRASLRHSPHPTRFHARGNRGAAATINEAVASSSGEFINVLNSDDLFTTSRVATMVYEVAGTGVQWGFSRVAFIDQDGAALTPESSSRVADLGFLGDDVAARDAVSMSFLSGNAAVSTGALFFSRSLFDRLNGFRDLRYNHDWDFCLRASIVAEPLFVPTAQYQYRIHDANTILESVSAARSEADAMFSGFYAEALRTPAPQNPFAPVPAVWGARFFEQALGCGHAAILPPEVLRELVQRVATHDAGLSS
jgi:GT2 family glycosyltransferase